jgi:hypothetical protein
MIPTYKTFAEKDPRFNSSRPRDFAAVLAALSGLENAGYYFRGQADASRKLFTAIQREWISKQLQNRFPSIHAFVQQHVDYQHTHAATQLARHCQQLNDIATLSTLQHYGGPTPFLDFTSKKESAMFFATEGVRQTGNDETNACVSIYAWRPDAELFNWELQIDRYGGWQNAAKYETLQELGTIYIVITQVDCDPSGRKG